MRDLRVAAAALATSTILVLPTTALAHHRPGPCDVHRRDHESVRRHSKRLIRCAADRWVVRGGADRAICVADAESGLNPKATSPGGDYLGLFQHMAKAWPDRYRAWTRRSWELNDSALSGRTNAVVTMRMVNADGWGPWRGVGDC